MTFAYHKPTSLPEALALITAESKRCAILAGGTDLIVQWRTKAISPAGFIDISGLEELAAITTTESYLEIGAIVNHTRIATNDRISKTLPALAQACRSIGGTQIQNMGTIGGNVMNASPAADTPPVLMAYEAEFLVQNLNGQRWIDAADFFTGYKETALKPDELLTRIRIPAPVESEQAKFYKIGARRAQAISKVSTCIRSSISHGGIEWIKIAVASVAPTVIRAYGTEALLTKKAITQGLIDDAHKSLADELKPIDDIRSTADYRRFAAAGLLKRYFTEVTTL